MRNNTKLI